MDELDKWVKAGKLTWEAIEYAKKILKPGKTYFEVAEEAEGFIRKNGGEPSFPANLSANNEAAHYSPGIDDKKVIGEKDIVKVDMGAHIDGYIGDAALTVDLSGENSKLVEASEKALENALSLVKAGQHSRRISEEIANTIKGYGFEPIRNLGGHVISRWILHTGYSVPDFPANDFELKEDMILALEPFASMGKGLVHDGTFTSIFSIASSPRVRGQTARKVYAFAMDKFKTLPFSERWLTKVSSGLSLKLALRELVTAGSFTAYPILIDSGLVSQREVTMLVEKDGCKVLTK